MDGVTLPSGLASAAFGLATRRGFFDYLRAVALILFILLMVAWTIDLAKSLPELRRVAEDRGAPLHGIAARYLFYRTVDMVTRLLPMACFFGAFIAEIRRRLTLETVILHAAGASTLRLLAGALWLGLLLGALQTALEARWRPAVIWAQVEFGVGDYARRFGPGWLNTPRWFVTEDMAIRGEVLREAAPHMRDVKVFAGIRAPELKQVFSAETMRPGPAPFTWRLEGVTRWDGGSFRGTPSADVTIETKLLPEMLTYLDVLKFNLPGSSLAAFAALPEPIPEVETAKWRRLTAWALPGALILFGAGLARMGFDGRRAVVPRLIGLAAFGYVVVVSVKVFWKVGEMGALPAPIAASAGMSLALGALLVFPLATKVRHLVF
jgi:lipopolysaccharide export LptBFGC system permease protein LptF